MNRLFYYLLILFFPVLKKAEGQGGSFLLSGNALQPHICVDGATAAKGKNADSSLPCLYLLSGDVPAAFPVAGTYTASNSGYCFDPLYPLGAGQRFLLRAPGCRDTVIATAAETAAPSIATGVADFYPLTDSIPENILFFHVRFTQAMTEDREAWMKVSVRDEQGVLVPHTWRQRSFWLDSGRLLVLMIHPGRIKTGIRYIGPVFSRGKQYTITVDSSLLDIYGRHLGKTESHRYYILPGQHTVLQSCKVTRRLSAGSMEPLLVRFCNGIDHAAACTGILMYDADDKPLSCTIQQYEECTVSIQPHDPWPKGKLRLELSGALYDCAGNRQQRLFEMKSRKQFRKDKLSRDFRITAE